VVLACLPAGASADELGVDAYAARLRDARALLASARTQSGPAREASTRAAEELLRRTTSVRLPDGERLAVSDGPIADRVARSELDAALAQLDAAIASAERVQDGVPGEAADARLRELLEQQQARTSGLTLFAVARALADRLFGWAPRPDLGVLVPALGLTGIALAAVLALLIARGARERLRREVHLPAARGDLRRDPGAHLARADAVLHAGSPRDAIHSLYLYALASLAAREVLPDDPALTDQELLSRAAGTARVGELRELMRLHDTVWFGLREAAGRDAARARDLATAVAG
jgi:hypothetical protein